MAVLSIEALTDHDAKVVKREHHADTVLQATCSCGYRGPTYPLNDRGSAEQAVAIHLRVEGTGAVKWQWKLRAGPTWRHVGPPDAMTSATRPTRLDAKPRRPILSR